MPTKALRNTLLLSAVAVAATGATVGGGVASGVDNRDLDAVASGLALGTPDQTADLERSATVSRSERRTAEAGRTGLSVSARPKISRREPAPQPTSRELTPRELGRALLPEFGFAPDQFGCLDSLYVSESNWRIDADNPTSSAYGIPQALTQTHDLPEGYLTSAEVQIRWGLGYIQDRYGTPCNAWAFKQGNNWY